MEIPKKYKLKKKKFFAILKLILLSIFNLTFKQLRMCSNKRKNKKNIDGLNMCTYNFIKSQVLKRKRKHLYIFGCRFILLI